MMSSKGALGLRRVGSAALLALAAIVLLLGELTLFARAELLDADRFADRAAGTLEDSDVRDAAALRLTDELQGVDPNLVAVRPLIEQGASTLVGLGVFEDLTRTAISQAHGAVFEGNDAVVRVGGDIAVLAIQALSRLDPKVGRQIPKDFEADLITISKGDATAETARIAHDVRVLGIVLPILALLLFAAAVLLAPVRMAALTRVGLAVAGVGVVVVIGLIVVRELFLGRADNDTDRAALGAIWDAFGSDLRNWSFVLCGVGVALASVAHYSAASAIDQPLRHLAERVTTTPQTTRARLGWSLAIGAVGLVMVAAPEFAVRAVVVVAGLYVVLWTISELLRLAIGSIHRARASHDRGWLGAYLRRRAPRLGLLALAAGAVGTVLLAATVLGGADEEQQVQTCNGHRSLCEKRLNQVSFAATHNSYAGANVPDFLFPEQDDGIGEQLAAGVRGLWIDAYYGLPGDRVYTQTNRIDPALDATLKQEFGPKFEQAVGRIREQVAKPEDVEPRIYLCHGFCEQGSVDALEAFQDIARFLDDNPGEVLIIDIEDYVTPKDMVDLIERSGLGDHVYRGPFSKPWPRLRHMIELDQRVLIMAEHMPGGASWYRRAYSIFQETPFSFKRPGQMSCSPNRGSSNNSLFLINHWINTDPAPEPTNAGKVNSRGFLLDRVRRCQRERDLTATAVAVDFYRQGDLLEVVDALNGVDSGN